MRLEGGKMIVEYEVRYCVNCKEYTYQTKEPQKDNKWKCIKCKSNLIKEVK